MKFSEQSEENLGERSATSEPYNACYTPRTEPYGAKRNIVR
jgi:hypothetical protein